MVKEKNYLIYSIVFLFAALVLVSILVSTQGCTTTVGQKPILTMQDVKSLAPVDLADFAISLYNKRADWYKDRISHWDTLTDDQQKQAKRDYTLLCESWGIIDLYDRLVTAGQPSEDIRIEIYRFMEKYLGGE